MSQSSRLRVSWVLMVLVVLVGLLGANKIMHSPSTLHRAVPGQLPVADAQRAAAQAVPSATPVVATGIVTPEGETVPLIPSVKGEVIEVLAKAEQQVKKGEVLLRMDDRFQREQLKQAEAALAGAQSALREAEDALKRGIEQWEKERAVQMTKIRISQAEYDAAQEKVARLKHLVDQRLSATAEADYAAALKGLTALELAIKAQQQGLELVESKKPTASFDRLKAAVQQAESVVRQAKLQLEMCELRAPADGTIMQVFAAPGTKFGEQAVKPAFLFYTGDLIVKAEINQEWASRVKEGMPAVVEDHSGNGQTWRGRVTHVAKSFLPKRDALEIPGLPQQAAELVLECRITLDPGQNQPFLNQKVRVKIGQ